MGESIQKTVAPGFAARMKSEGLIWAKRLGEARGPKLEGCSRFQEELAWDRVTLHSWHKLRRSSGWSSTVECGGIFFVVVPD